MKQPKVNSEKLCKEIDRLIRTRFKTSAQASKDLGIEASRLSKFRSGDFARLSPVLLNLCHKLGISEKDHQKNIKPALKAKLFQELEAVLKIKPNRIGLMRGLIKVIRKHQ